MDADARSKPRASHTFLPPPPALYRARSARVADLAAGGGGGAAFSGPPDTPPRRSKVAVPFRWEEAPGKPKAAPPPPTPTTCAADAADATLDAGPVPEGDPPRQDSSHHAPAADQMPLLPLKLPPRLQRAASFAAGASPAPAAGNAAGTVPDGDPRQDSSSDHAAAEHERPPRLLKLPPRLQRVASFAATPSEYTPSPSPKTVLHENPYFGRAGGGGGGKCGKPPKWVRSGGAALRRTPSAGMAFLSRTLSKRQGSSRNGAGAGDHERDGTGPGPDAPWWSPSSSSSLSSVSGGRGRPADGREASSSEDDGSPRGSASVRITRTRLTRNRSLPSMTTSNLWASVRRSVKHITPILHGARSWATTRYGHW